jgi:hypothetical protein
VGPEPHLHLHPERAAQQFAVVPHCVSAEMSVLPNYPKYSQNDGAAPVILGAELGSGDGRYLASGPSNRR